MSDLLVYRKVDSPVTIIRIDFTRRSYSVIGVFSKNAITKATRHVKLCGRNGVTRKDMEYALKYEVFDFLGNPDVFSEISKFVMLFRKRKRRR